MRKKYLVFILVMCLGLLLANPVFASPTSSPPSENALSDAGIESLGLLAFGDCAIANLGGGRVASDGSTTAQFIVDQVGIKLYLQRWNGTAWIDVYSSTTFTSYNSDYTDGYTTFFVQTGYYYRTKAVHSAYDGGFYEEMTSYSGYVYI